MIHSLEAKLVAVYMAIVLLFIGILGVTLTLAYKHNLIDLRESDVTDSARQLAQMFEDGDLGVVAIELGENIPVLRTTARDYDATILLVNAESRLINYYYDQNGVRVMNENREVSPDIYETVYEQREVYLRSDYLEAERQVRVSTIAYPIFNMNSGENEKPWAILIINSDLSGIYSAFERIVVTMWVPMLAVLVLGFAVTYVTIRGIVKRVKILNEATKRVAKGTFDRRVEFRQKDEIAQLADSFNKMAEELAASDAVKRDFVSNAAHELRSPMTSINGFVEGMLDGTIPEEKYPEYLTVVSTEVKRLTKLVNSMLDLSRIESGRDKFQIVPFDINEIIRRVVIRFSQKIENAGIVPEIELDGDRLSVLADPDKIEEVLQNLIDNAIRFTPEGKGLYISTKRDGDTVLVRIRDEGTGIAPEDLRFIWDRFYTVDKAHTGHKSGTGLGLAIVKSIIEQHRQSIRVESEPGQGTMFEFTLNAEVK